jgi:hypothetical protein
MTSSIAPVDIVDSGDWRMAVGGEGYQWVYGSTVAQSCMPTLCTSAERERERERLLCCDLEGCYGMSCY